MEFGPRALGGALDHRRSAVAAHAVDDEPEDQVPRVVPALRAVGAARARRRVVRVSRATAPTCCSSPTSARRGGCRCPTTPDALWGIEKLNVPRSTIPAVTHVDYSARIQTVRRGDQPVLLRHRRRLLPPDRLPGDREHVVQRPRRTDRLHARGRLPLLHAHRHGRPRARGLPARQDRADARRRRTIPGERNSRSIDPRTERSGRADLAGRVRRAAR